MRVLEVLDDVPDAIPDDVLRRRGLVPRTTALRGIHTPDGWADVETGRRRLRYEEALVLQVTLAQRRRAVAGQSTRSRAARPGGILDAFDTRLPFALTAGQREIGEQVAAELAAEVPMHRLLQGEVGSGKTVVALRAMLQAVDAGGQAALLAPTEVLAQQHHRTITAMLGDLAEGGMLGGAQDGTRVALLTGSQSAAERRRALLDIASGDAGVVVGTHALLEEKVDFQDLALVVVDEQHRFGVEQRDALRGKGNVPPHVLVMTATPIPRTVAMTVFGDLETSTLRELPAGRAPTTTHVVPELRPGWMSRTWARVGEEVAAGRQVYVVCPRIGDDDAADEGTELRAEVGDDGDPPARGEGSPSPRPLASVAAVHTQLEVEPALSGV
ncbi:MAG: DEAD/DEAH box helicase, partial [Phycicoccus sp.]